MQLNIRMFFQQRGPFLLRFLHSVFTEHALPRINQRRDPLSRMRLANRDQGHIIDRTLASFAGAGDIVVNRGEQILG